MRVYFLCTERLNVFGNRWSGLIKRLTEAALSLHKGAQRIRSKYTFIVRFGSVPLQQKVLKIKAFNLSSLTVGKKKINSPVTDQRVNGAEPTVYGFLFVLQNKK